MAILKQVGKFLDILKKKSNTELKNASKNSVKWFKDNVEKSFKSKITQMGSNRWVYSRLTGADKEFKQAIRTVNLPLIGHMYFYIYDPKWKNELPYYDTFPLVIPIGYTNNGFIGINFHYLPPVLRAKLLDQLLTFKAKTKDRANGEQEYLKLSYSLLSRLGSSIYKPTIKRYILTNVGSKFAEVHSDEWEQAVFLPVESFQKANKRAVWADSKDSI